jgi:hypothetical protein
VFVFNLQQPLIMSKISKTKQKEQRIKNFLANYPIQFDMEDSAIDLRTMSQNYENGIIPSKDITEAVNAVLGTPPMPRGSVDPRTLGVPMFTWAPVDDIGIDPRFQRDIAPNHCTKIESDFRADMIIVPCAVKDPITGKFLLWDGNHTRQVCERMGWSHIPVWYTEALIDDEHSLAEATKILVLKAGRSFLTINKKNKRPVNRYDEHMVSVECGEPESIVVQNICDANQVQIRRASTKPGDISHIEHLYGAYNLVQASSGVKGIYLARALKFCRTTWPKEEIRAIVMLGMARLYQHTETQTGSLLPQDFDDELGDILRKKYGPAEAVHDETTGFKAQYIRHFGSLAGHPEVVTSGLILTYNKHNTKGYKLAQPESTYPVK